jgi:hypothetical protein
MIATTFKTALECLGQYNPDMIVSVQERSTTEAFDFFKETKQLLTASHAYRIILFDPCAPEKKCNVFDQYADLCIQGPLTKEIVDQALLNANRLKDKTA